MSQRQSKKRPLSPKPKRPRVEGYPAELSASDDDVGVFEAPEPEGYLAWNEEEIREHNRSVVTNVQRKDQAYLTALFYEVVRLHYPESYAIMCSQKLGPLIQAPRRDPPTPEQLQHAIFGQLIRLQSTLNITKKGEFTFYKSFQTF